MRLPSTGILDWSAALELGVTPRAAQPEAGARTGSRCEVRRRFSSWWNNYP
jgi:hypothetical protein